MALMQIVSYEDTITAWRVNLRVVSVVVRRNDVICFLELVGGWKIS